MRLMIACLAVLVCSAAASADLPINLPLDQQINIGLGDAIFSGPGHQEFLTEGGDGFCRNYLNFGYNMQVPRIFLDRTPLGNQIFPPTGVFTADLRYFQHDLYDWVLNPDTQEWEYVVVRTAYEDAPVFAYLTDTAGAHYGLGLMYGTAPWVTGDPYVPPDEYYPVWSTKSVAWDFSQPGQWPYTPTFDRNKIQKITFYVTNWANMPDGNILDADRWVDHLDVKDVAITPEPSALAMLVLGGLALLRRR